MQAQEKLRVGILGGTGLVGQRLLTMLATHPWFTVEAIGASRRSVGRPYGEIVRWRLAGEPPARIAARPVRNCSPGEFDDCDLVLASLGSDVAGPVERSFAEAGIPVISNSSVHRMTEGVPLVIPEVNAEHLDRLRRFGNSDRGYIVTNPNCSVVGLALALAPLHAAFRVRKIVVSTLQAISGAGVDGPSALEAVDNVIPFIPGEEEKIGPEVGKIFDADILVSAHCHRVPTVDGHLLAVSVETSDRAGPEDAARVLEDFRGHAEALELPSAPEPPIIVRRECDRPQPRLDRDAGDGMAVVVGRIRVCPVLTLRMEVLSHNTVRGAAGAAVLNAELLVRRNLLGRRGPR